MMEHVDCIVIGAGVVGLAVARELALAGREVVVLESAALIGSETSSRNSEVIHAGLYYPPGSLKAHCCVAGKQLIYSYCAERGIEARAIGKLLVACNEGQIAKLKAIEENARRNGVHDLRWLTKDEARAIEPEVTCTAAVFSPSSGILDSHRYMLAMQGDLEDAGGVIAFNSPVESGRVEDGKVVLNASGGIELKANLVVNAAGLNAPSVARSIDGIEKALLPRTYLAKGHYFALTGTRSPFRHLIYPMPDEATLGLHATLDLGGGVRFGPDVEWIDKIDYDVDAARAPKFAASVREYWPGLPDGALVPAYTGIRPKIVGAGQPAADFVFHGPAQHGAAGLWNLFGIELPGLTSSLAIAAELRHRITQQEAAN